MLCCKMSIRITVKEELDKYTGELLAWVTEWLADKLSEPMVILTGLAR